MARASASGRVDPPEQGFDGIQAAVMDYCRARKGGRELAIHIPNEGKRSRRNGALLKRQGLTPGVLDILIPVARGGFFGMWLELKRSGKPMSVEQVAFMARMQEQGYFCTCQDSIEGAIRAIELYFRLVPTTSLFASHDSTSAPGLVAPRCVRG